jgi:hypothetical protein
MRMKIGRINGRMDLIVLYRGRRGEVEAARGPVKRENSYLSWWWLVQYHGDRNQAKPANEQWWRPYFFLV